jgi:hypothetical protein
MDPQPFRAGLKFSYRPYGPGSDLRFIAGYPLPGWADVCAAGPTCLDDLLGRTQRFPAKPTPRRVVVTDEAKLERADLDKSDSQPSLPD